MKVLSRTSDGLKRCYNVLVTLEDVEKVKTAKLQEIAKNMKMAGFRPGKVPVDVARRMYGDSLNAEAKKTTMENESRNILRNENLSISFNFENDIVKEDENGIEFTLKFELIPSFELKDFSKIELVKHVVEVGEDETNNVLEDIRKAHKNWVEDKASKKVKEGQKIVIDLNLLTKIKKHENDKIENLEITVGDKSLVDDFWKHLIDAKVGSEVEFDINYPKDFGDKNLAGKVVHYSAVIKKILKEEEFKLDDEFAKAIGYENLEKAKAWAKSRAIAKYDYMSKDIMKRDLLDKITELYDFEVPTNMIDAEQKEVVKQIKVEAQRFKKEFTPEIEKECREISIKRVRLGFVVAEIAKKEKISVTREEVDRAIRNIAMMYPGQEKSIFEMYYNHPEAVSAVVGPVLENKVVEFLLSKITPKEEKCSVQELIAIDEEPFDFFKDDAEEKTSEKKKSARKTSEEKSESETAEKKKKVTKKSEEKKSAEAEKKPSKKTKKAE